MNRSFFSHLCVGLLLTVFLAPISFAASNEYLEHQKLIYEYQQVAQEFRLPEDYQQMRDRFQSFINAAPEERVSYRADALEFLKMHLDVTVQKLDLAQMQLDILAQSDITLGIELEVNASYLQEISSNLVRIRADLDDLNANSTSFSAEIAIPLEEIQTVWAEAKIVLENTFSLFLFDSAAHILAYVQEKEADVAELVAVAEGSVADQAHAAELLDELELAVRQAEIVFENGLAAFDASLQDSERAALREESNAELLSFYSLLRKAHTAYQELRIALLYLDIPVERQ